LVIDRSMCYSPVVDEGQWLVMKKKGRENGCDHDPRAPISKNGWHAIVCILFFPFQILRRFGFLDILFLICIWIYSVYLNIQ
jgi:hypothetical protein